ncbi:MAG: SMP-30/gluconolactonase/LRE family protein, partial [bacterium]|nr:SMP-30/gluconolactonase/LRE family protein [bacterium]
MKRLLGLLFVVAAAAQTQPDFTGPVTVEQIATGFENTEGPHWRAAGYLVFSDIRGDTVYQWTQAGGAEVFHRPSGNSNGLDEDSQGRLLVAQHGKRRMARLETGGAETALATHYGGKRLNSPNDIAVRSDGSTYFTDPPYGITPQEEELGFRGVYRVTGDPAAPELLVDNLDRPNGIVFSPDESLLYVADTTGLRVVAFDVADDGTLGNQRVFLTFSGSNRPDGMEVDGAGNLYVAGTQGSVWIYSPAGDLIGSIDVPERTRNLAWGGTDGRSLFVTSGASVYRVRAVPGAGQFPEFTLLPGGEYEMG